MTGDVTGKGRRSWLRVDGTRAWLVRQLSLLLVAAVVMLVTSLWAVTIVADTAGTVRDRTTEAVLETAAARLALTSADRAVITSFASGGAALAGPGQDYANRLAAANQSLAKVAEANQSATGGGDLQVVVGLVAAYADAIGQADAHYRNPDAVGLGVADLWHASRLLHASGGVLDQLEALQGEQRAALTRQLDEGTAWPALLWSLPVAVFVPVLLLGLLGWTQWELFRRFRRKLNVWLAAATAITLAVFVAMIFTVSQHGRLDQVGDRVDTVLAERQAAIDHGDADGQRALAELLAARCGADGCGVTVEGFRASLPAAVADQDRATDARRVTAQTGVATDSGGREWWVPLLSLLVCGLVVRGLLDRLREYRYRA